MGYRVMRADECPWEDRPATEVTGPRSLVDVTTIGELKESRARLWRLPPGSRGRRHKELVQEEVFVVLSGTLTLLLGDPPERVAVTAGSLVTVAPGTAIQQRNESEQDVVVFAYGAPPVTGQAEYLDDIKH
jgi:mannose-6-phosphate isomerase-like protein (cupin superfamily)